MYGGMIVFSAWLSSMVCSQLPTGQGRLSSQSAGHEEPCSWARYFTRTSVFTDTTSQSSLYNRFYATYNYYI